MGKFRRKFPAPLTYPDRQTLTAFQRRGAVSRGTAIPARTRSNRAGGRRTARPIRHSRGPRTSTGGGGALPGAGTACRGWCGPAHSSSQPTRNSRRRRAVEAFPGRFHSLPWVNADLGTHGLPTRKCFLRGFVAWVEQRERAHHSADRAELLDREFHGHCLLTHRLAAFRSRAFARIRSYRCSFVGGTWVCHPVGSGAHCE
jgi:hypothetical protein